MRHGSQLFIYGFYFTSGPVFLNPRVGLCLHETDTLGEEGVTSVFLP